MTRKHAFSKDTFVITVDENDMGKLREMSETMGRPVTRLAKECFLRGLDTIYSYHELEA